MSYKNFNINKGSLFKLNDIHTRYITAQNQCITFIYNHKLKFMEEYPWLAGWHLIFNTDYFQHELDKGSLFTYTAHLGKRGEEPLNDWVAL